MEEENIFELLNDIKRNKRLSNQQNKEYSEIFLDDNGLPTDSFLQSLKDNSTNLSTTHLSTSIPQKNSNKNYQQFTNYKYHLNENNNFHENGNNIIQPKKSNELFLQSFRSHSDTDSYNSSESDDDSNDDQINNNQFHNNHSNILMEQYRSRYSSKKKNQPSRSRSATTRNSSNSYTKQSKKLRSKVSHKLSSSPPPSYAPNTPSYRLYDPNIQQVKSKVTKEKNTKKDTNILNGETNPYLTSSIETLKHNYNIQHAHTDNERKSLNLRLQGQLQTIRVLETQLADATNTISLKDGQLQEVMKRLHTLELREKKRLKQDLEDKTNITTGNERLKLEEKKFLQLQNEYRQLENKFSEEQIRRQRSEERVKVMQTYLQKNKEKVNVTEDQLTTYEETIQALQSKLLKMKKEYKLLQDNIIEERKKREINEKDKEHEVEKRELSERMNRELRSTNEVLKEEIKLLRQDIGLKEEKERRMILEIEILKEREKDRERLKRVTVSTHTNQNNQSYNNNNNNNQNNLNQQYNKKIEKEKEVNELITQNKKKFNQFNDLRSEVKEIHGKKKRPSSAPHFSRPYYGTYDDETTERSDKSEDERNFERFTRRSFSDQHKNKRSLSVSSSDRRKKNEDIQQSQHLSKNYNNYIESNDNHISDNNNNINQVTTNNTQTKINGNKYQNMMNKKELIHENDKEKQVKKDPKNLLIKRETILRKDRHELNIQSDDSDNNSDDKFEDFEAKNLYSKEIKKETSNPSKHNSLKSTYHQNNLNNQHDSEDSNPNASAVKKEYEKLNKIYERVNGKKKFSNFER